ncbi:hypothetical protein LTS18_010049, partial [Coniosporium uncinatum]
NRPFGYGLSTGPHDPVRHTCVTTIDAETDAGGTSGAAKWARPTTSDRDIAKRMRQSQFMRSEE